MVPARHPLGAHALIQQLHERMETIRLTLPAFVRVLEAAHRQARQIAPDAAGLRGRRNSAWANLGDKRSGGQSK